MDHATAELKELQLIADEAVELHGADWVRVQAHIRAGLARLSNHERTSLDHVLLAVGRAGHGEDSNHKLQ